MTAIVMTQTMGVTCMEMLQGLVCVSDTKVSSAPHRRRRRGTDDPERKRSE
ncbi:hypothetical protein GCM10009846_08730 [Agrococcus versicolor]|uniref:Uncharacterized protein n=1 Tax=Agrococcus versicolor TaxID=501482 RepID=A0ABP5MDW6_9MICO